MKIRFLGTAAAEGFPALFCTCSNCEEARKRGGRNYRTRSSVLIDDVLKIDFPPDTMYHVHRDGLDLSKVHDLFLTHTHSDHLYAEDLLMRLPVFAHGTEHPLNVYGHDLAIRLCKNVVASPPADRLSYKLIQPFRPVEAETAVITPLLADHDRGETCLLFYIERDGKTIFYGHDTGWLPEETWAWLRGKRIDLAILDCTSGLVGGRINHMNNEAVIDMKKAFLEQGMFHEDSVTVATHFSHNCGLQHDELVSIFEQHGIVTAYDGMVFEL
ncbi:hypothetical protein J31TS4_09820 [Paenibacillus sp. J31TS4]|uniref:MBL fold metallo-hydrolase n=1 Tax=Paenibacillus sp. J31TS4 TaxID=2807195 RepID=UPI001AFE6784|nr:MBL fold metallo-hydrolase [Paenibacillus sp. J31TS4]GIP37702.1 hypothetical protein J31TS4_09820 [Paenibacillus sp. J31TS4]